MAFGFGIASRYVPWWIIGSAIILAGIVAMLIWLERRRAARLHRFVEARLAPRLMPGYEASSRKPLFWLTALGSFFMVLVFLQPHWGQSWKEIRRVSRDIVIVLDTSDSMRAQNPLPNRLERAKQKINTLLETAAGDRFALIAFAGSAELQSPLTVDHGYFKSVLKTVDTDTISKKGTDIAAALDSAIELLKTEDAEGGEGGRGSRAILLISDGEQVSGDAVKKAEEAAKYARIFVIGVGDPRGAEVEVPDWMTKYLKGAERTAKHFSVLDEETLQKVALAGNGAYTRSRVDTSDIQELFKRFEVLSARDVSGDVRLRLVNRYQWPLAAAIACFGAEGAWLIVLPWLRSRRLRRMAAAPRGGEYA